MRRRAFLRTVAGLFVPAIIGRAEIPLRLADGAFVGRHHASAAVTPATVGTNLKGWWKADSFSLADGTQIGGTGNHWIDQSGNGQDLSGSNGPQYKVAGGSTSQFASMPAVSWVSGTGAVGLNFTTAETTIADFTAIFVLKKGGDVVLMGHSTDNIQFRFNLSGGDKVATYFQSVTTQSISAMTTASNGVLMISYRRTANVISFRENKTDLGTSGGGDSTTFRLNRFGDTSFGQPIVGPLGEACFYRSKLSDADVDNLYDNYFKARWGLP